MANEQPKWKSINMGEILPCQSFLRKKDGEILKLSTIGGVKVGQDCYYLPVDEVINVIKDYPVEESEDERIINNIKKVIGWYRGMFTEKSLIPEEYQEIDAWLEKQGEHKPTAEEVLIKAGLKPYKDGNQWCVLLGDNIQEGICGFGNTIEDALYAFLKDLIASQGEQKPAIIDFKAKDWYVSKVDGKIYDITFQKIKEAGYEWDAEHKQLKKIEQKPAEWTHKDGKNLAELWEILSVHRNTIPQVDNLMEWVKDLVSYKRQEWSEEDESHIRYLIECLEHCKKGVALTMTTSTAQEYINWLKSLRPQSHWKPSGEQLYTLEKATHIVGSKYKSCLNSLYSELKKLREE